MWAKGSSRLARDNHSYEFEENSMGDAEGKVELLAFLFIHPVHKECSYKPIQSC